MEVTAGNELLLTFSTLDDVVVAGLDDVIRVVLFIAAILVDKTGDVDCEADGLA